MKKKLLGIIITGLILPMGVLAKDYQDIDFKEGMVFNSGDRYRAIKNVPNVFESYDGGYEKYRWFEPIYRVNGNYYGDFGYIESKFSSDYYDWYTFPQYNDQDVKWELTSFGYKNIRNVTVPCYELPEYSDSSSSNPYNPYNSSSSSSSGSAPVTYCQKDLAEYFATEFDMVQDPIEKPVPGVYQKPEIGLQCDKNSVKAGEDINCKVYIDNRYDITDAEFILDSDEIDIQKVVPNTGWLVEKLDNGTQKLTLEENKTIKSVINLGENEVNYIADFEGAAEKDITEDAEGSLNAKEFEYTDIITTDRLEDVKLTLKIEKTEQDIETPKEDEEEKEPSKEEELEENPETGIYDYLFLTPIILLIGYGVYTVNKKKNKFIKL